MNKVLVNTDRCKGCSLCVEACPKNVLGLSDKLNKLGHPAVEVKDDDACISCAMCALMCPDCILTVTKPE
jgi:Dissimilatory sulfite reductase (desulfoviridin), alpha and beta subunits